MDYTQDKWLENLLWMGIIVAALVFVILAYSKENNHNTKLDTILAELQPSA